MHGDSFCADLTLDSIRKLFSDFDASSLKQKHEENLREKIAHYENKYFPDDSFKFGLFRLCTFYLDAYETVGQEKQRIKNTDFDLLEPKIKWRGGEVSREIESHTTHIVLDKK